MKNHRRVWSGPSLLAVIALTSSLATQQAQADQTFAAGAIIIPMDTTYQDSGMLRAFGLLYALLKADVPVHWVIKSPKNLGDADFTATCTDFKTGTPLAAHAYRGGPFVVESSEAAKATPIINTWQTANASTTVHVSTQDFVARSGRFLTAAPTIAIIADGKEDVAFSYLNAAGIPDRSGNSWTGSSPDLLSIAEIEGPTSTNHCDGALFRSSGQPNYCQIMTMHWGVKDVWGVHDEAVAEYRCFLGYPVHMFAECQAVNAVENDVYGKFITTTGFVIDNNIKSSGPFSFLNMDQPFAQMDGPFNLVGGSEIAYSLPAGGAYYDQNVVMIKDAATPLGQRSVWMTGYLNGECVIAENSDTGGMFCKAGVGKVSYLGGHQYGVKLPISTNPTTQGARLFLNSLFEAGCVTNEGQPVVNLSKSGPTTTTSPTVTYWLSWNNFGPGPALDFVISDTLPAGASYVSSTGGGVLTGSKVTWTLGDLVAYGSGSVQLTVLLPSYGSYTNGFDASYTVGLNSKTVTSNTVTTSYQEPPPAPDAGASPDGVVTGDSGTSLDGAATDGAAKDAGAAVDANQAGDANQADAAGCLPLGSTCTGSAHCCSTLCLVGQCIASPPIPDASALDAPLPAGDASNVPADAAAILDDAPVVADQGSTTAESSTSHDMASTAPDGPTSSGDTAAPGDAKQPRDGGVPSGGDGARTEIGSGPGGDARGGPAGGAPAGCSCRTAGSTGSPSPLLAFLGVALALLNRRRRWRRAGGQRRDEP